MAAAGDESGDGGGDAAGDAAAAGDDDDDDDDALNHPQGVVHFDAEAMVVVRWGQSYSDSLMARSPVPAPSAPA